MLLRDFAAYLRTAPDRDHYHVVNRSELAAEEGAFAPQEPKLQLLARVVEGDGELRARAVETRDGTRFTHFLDGIERQGAKCYYRRLFPMLHYFTAAVIRRRGEGRLMSTWNWQQKESLYLPGGYFDTSDLARRVSLELVMEADGKPIEPNPGLMALRCRERAQRDRESLETALLAHWTHDFSGSREHWLLVDGSLAYVEERHPNVVGLIKSHETQYFPAEEQIRILSLAAGERSSVFQVRRGGGSPPLTWYLRLRPNEGRDVYFGLVRLEIADVPGAMDRVDDISGWVLAERLPLSLPDGRWDRLLYPIRDCEQFLRSIAPSRVMMEAAMAGV